MDLLPNVLSVVRDTPWIVRTSLRRNQYKSTHSDHADQKSDFLLAIKSSPVWANFGGPADIRTDPHFSARQPAHPEPFVARPSLRQPHTSLT